MHSLTKTEFSSADRCIFTAGWRWMQFISECTGKTVGKITTLSTLNVDHMGIRHYCFKQLDTIHAHDTTYWKYTSGQLSDVLYYRLLIFSECSPIFSLHILFCFFANMGGQKMRVCLSSGGGGHMGLPPSIISISAPASSLRAPLPLSADGPRRMLGRC